MPRPIVYYVWNIFFGIMFSLCNSSTVVHVLIMQFITLYYKYMQYMDYIVWLFICTLYIGLPQQL